MVTGTVSYRALPGGASVRRQERKHMNKRGVFFLLALILAAVNPSEAQQAKKMARIGYLSPLSGPSRTLEIFKEGLRELGWARGNRSNLSIATPGTALISFLNLPLNLFASKLTSSSRGLAAGWLLQQKLRLQ
jgi:hypothetical protein